MDCSVIQCKCSCHKLYPQELNIKELLISQMEMEMELELETEPEMKSNTASKSSTASKSNTASKGNNSDDESANHFKNKDQDSLWERRRKLHSGEIKPHKYEDFKQHFQSHESLIQQIPDFNNDDDLKLLQKEQNAKKAIQKVAQGKRKIESDDLNDPDREPVILNPLHKYKITERDNIIKDVYTRALKSMQIVHPSVDFKSSIFKDYVNDEADRLLKIWMEGENKR